MRQDPISMLESHFARQTRHPSGAFCHRMEESLSEEMAGTDFTPVVSGLRKGLPLAAALILGVLTPAVSQKDVAVLADEIEQSQASSVQAELEIPWQD